MTYKPEIKKLLARYNASEKKAITEMTVQDSRKGMHTFYKDLRGEHQDVAKVTNVNIPTSDNEEIGLRIYTPENEGSFPVLVYYHGGGWIRGDLEIVDPILRWVTNEIKAVVVSVNYRLAPEYQFPIPVEDCYTATKWVEGNIQRYHGDPEKVAVGGDSAGGNIAAAVALMARDRGELNIALQVLLYPAVDFTMTSKSYLENGKGNYLETEAMEWFSNHYFHKKEDRKNQYAAPLLAKNFIGLPPALILTAEYDVLRDDGEAYARQLKEAQVPVIYECFPGQIHGFFWMPGITNDAHKALKMIKQAFEKQFSI